MAGSTRAPHKDTCACACCSGKRARLARQGAQEAHPLTDRERPELASVLAGVALGAESGTSKPSPKPKPALTPSLQSRYLASKDPKFQLPKTSRKKGVRTNGPAPGSLQPLSANVMVVEESGTRRGRIASWLQMRIADPAITMRQASLNMGLSPGYLAGVVSQAVKEGWLRFEDPLERIEHELVPKTLDNLSSMLSEGNEKVTIETAKGVVFPIYRESKGVSDAPQTVLALRIEGLPGAGDAPLAIRGEVVGKAREVIDIHVKES